jgi:chromate transporter
LQNNGVKFKEALRFWVKLGFINFGGPAGQIAIMHKEIVDKKGWISKAQQLATYIGWRLHGIVGGNVAGSLFSDTVHLCSVIFELVGSCLL